MSKLIKNMIAGSLETRYEGLDSAVWIELIGVDGVTTNEFRRALRAKRDLQGQIALAIQSPGAKLVGALLGPGSRIAGALKSLIEKLEKGEALAAVTTTPAATAAEFESASEPEPPVESAAAAESAPA